MASNAHTAAFYGHRETMMLCKDVDGNVIPWAPATSAKFRHWTQITYAGRGSPLHRAAELFNVNHYIVSQARPYLAPFLQSDMHGPSIMEKRGTISRMRYLRTRAAKNTRSIEVWAWSSCLVSRIRYPAAEL